MTDVKRQRAHTAQPPEPMKKHSLKAKKAAQKGHKGGANVMMGAAAGAVAGATIGGLAGAALADEKTRKAVSESISTMAKTAGETVKRLDENQDKLKKNLSDSANTLKETAGTVKESTEPMQQTGTKKS